jgi:hypothetical protein
VSTSEGDDLLRHIYSYVHGRVPPQYENLVTELVGRTVVLVMTTPEFYNHLKPIQELQMENWNLRQALIAYQRAERVRTTRKAAPKARKAPAKKAPAKKLPTSNVRAFKKGARGR